MATILAIVNAEKDGQIESKMMKGRQMEEIREARKAETEKRLTTKQEKMDDLKDGLRKKRKRAGGEEAEVKGTQPLKLKRKKVAFAS